VEDPEATVSSSEATAVADAQESLFAYGAFDENPDFWTAIDPVSYLSDLSGPVQLHHAEGDETVPVAFSKGLHQRIQEAGQVSELYVYEGDDHGISEHFEVAMQRSVAFFDRYVKGEGQP
jgi:fermentation-respiration switch protein FrsA (DUF1100 family)